MVPKSFQVALNTELRAFFAKQKAQSKSFDLRIGLLVDQIADVTLRGGDRLRPFLCALAFNPKNIDMHVEIAAVLMALELQHTYFLIHDDIMDQASTRRGKATIHAHLTQNLRNPVLANSLAILAGDLCTSWVQLLWDNCALSGTAGARILFDQMTEKVGLGQIVDVWGLQKADVNTIEAMYKAKSGNYSVKFPLLIGATLANKELLLPKLSAYGEPVGLAFQLKDDLLGVFGDEIVTGKSATNDISEGKWTLLMSYAYLHIPASKQKKLLGIIGKSPVTDTDYEWVKTVLVESGARTYIEKYMQKLVIQGLSASEKVAQPLRKELQKMAQFVISRNY